jgi:hypothetical protein
MEEVEGPSPRPLTVTTQSVASRTARLDSERNAADRPGAGLALRPGHGTFGVIAGTAGALLCGPVCSGAAGGAVGLGVGNLVAKPAAETVPSTGAKPALMPPPAA